MKREKTNDRFIITITFVKVQKIEGKDKNEIQKVMSKTKWKYAHHCLR